MLTLFPGNVSAGRYNPAFLKWLFPDQSVCHSRHNKIILFLYQLIQRLISLRYFRAGNDMLYLLFIRILLPLSANSD